MRLTCWHCNMYMYIAYLFFICFIKVLLFHEPLVRAETAVCRSHALLQLIQGTCKLRETIHLLTTWSASIYKNWSVPTLWCMINNITIKNPLFIILCMYTHYSILWLLHVQCICTCMREGLNTRYMYVHAGLRLGFLSIKWGQYGFSGILQGG